MKRKLSILVILIVLALGGVLWLKKTNAPADKNSSNSQSEAYKNISIKIEGANINLVNGNAETEIAPGSASKLVTKFFGNEAKADLNNDDKEDVVFLITQSGGGSGMFYYVIAALKTKNGYAGTNGILLGDRIAPQTTEIKNGRIIVNFADRKPGEPMTATPSVGVSKYFRLENGVLVGVL